MWLSQHLALLNNKTRHRHDCFAVVPIYFYMPLIRICSFIEIVELSNEWVASFCFICRNVYERLHHSILAILAWQMIVGCLCLYCIWRRTCVWAKGIYYDVYFWLRSQYPSCQNHSTHTALPLFCIFCFFFFIVVSMVHQRWCTYKLFTTPTQAPPHIHIQMRRRPCL